MCKARVIANKILVKLDDPEKQCGKIILPENTQRSKNQGVVIVVGSGHLLPSGERVALEVEEGQHIRFIENCAAELEDKYVVITEGDVLAILEN